MDHKLHRLVNLVCVYIHSCFDGISNVYSNKILDIPLTDGLILPSVYLSYPPAVQTEGDTSQADSP